ncbi:MAG: TonB-dependent receptor [Acidobacteriota bacterium]|nr:TonB-dependent receptor [Acidobacteriota bacterium]
MIVAKRIVLFTAALIALASMCWGQGTTGTINGVVTDPNGAAVPNARVVARNVDTSAETVGTTDSLGSYLFPNLSPGIYSLTVESTGFRKAAVAAQRLTVGDVLRQDIRLEIGQVTESVTIDAKATQVNTVDAQLGRSITDIPSLPILSGAGGRNALALTLTLPGVQAAGQVGPFSVNGQRAQANNYLLDGGDSNDLAINVPDAVTVISPNALSEYRLVTGSMNAEFGRNSGAVIEVTTASGKNTFHGIASETFRNTKLNAVPFFQNSVPGGTSTAFASGLPRKPQWNTNDFDANFGGRIIRDKTFFFASYLGFRRRQGVASSAVVPSDSQRSLINQFGTPEAKALLALIPAASTGNTLFTSPSNSLNRDQGVLRIDHYFNPNNELSGTYFIEQQVFTDPFAFGGGTIPGFGTSGNQRFQNIILRDAWTISPNLFNEARASFHRRATLSVIPLNHTKLSSLGLGKIVPDDPSAEGPPRVDISGFTTFGNTIQGPQGRYDDTFQYGDNVSWNKGRHNAKFGVDARWYDQNQVFDFINNGYLIIDGSGVQNGIGKRIPGLSDAQSDFANGFATEVVQNSAGRRGYRTHSTNLYAQDAWKLARNFTLDIGLRWEYNSPLKELHNREAAFRPGQQSTVFPDAPIGMVFPGDKGVSDSTYSAAWRNFAPRIGFAWDVFGTGKLSLRGGYGIFFDAPITELTLQFLTSPPYAIQPFTLFTPINNPWAGSLINPIPPPFPFSPVQPGQKFDFTNIAPISLTVMDPKFKTPYSNNFNLQVQYQFTGTWLLEVGYVGNTGINLLNRREINPAIPGPGANTGNTDLRRVFNQGNPQDAKFGGAVFSSITDQLSDANSFYSSLQVGLVKRFSHGLSTTMSYTYAHAIDDGSGLRVSQNPYSAKADRGNSEQDIRHRFVGTYIYEIPFMRDQKGFAGRVLGGWGISGIQTFQTGLPFNITEGTDRCLCAAGNNRPDYVGGNVVFYDPRSNTAVPGLGNAYFNGTGGGTSTAATNPFFHRVGSGLSFALGAGRYGNFGRNVFHGPGILNSDFSAFKRFTLYEAHTLEFRAEAFNLFNHTQFGNPNGAINSVNFGKVTTTVDPRIIQLSLRYRF